jgi:lipopolysaccharide/colanic/teichoic acid biosynthesis glycosyltransferase
MKRIFDIVCSLFALLVLSPILVFVSIILRFTGEREIFYRQDRMGRGGKTFGLYKFATMLKESPNIGTGIYTQKGDPRILPFGQFLRKTKINELPQILNILLGDMSIIGPRPLIPAQFHIYPDEAKKVIVQVRPGLSGIGSIVFRDEEAIVTNNPLGFKRCYDELIMPYKGQLEVWYVHHRSFWLDALLIFLTVWVVICPASKRWRTVLHELPDPPLELRKWL